MSDPNVPDFVRAALRDLDLPQSEPVLGRLAQYLDLLLEANEQVNLTAVREREAAWRRLIIDSLTVLPALDQLDAGAAVLDIGTGGGLPGMPLAIARPNLNVTLLETTGKKVRWLNHFIESLALGNTHAVQQRAETLGHDAAHRAHYDAAVSRAVGDISAVLEYSLPLVKPGGRLLAMKGPKVEQELDLAGDALDLLGAGDLQIVDAYPDTFDNDLVIVSIIKERPTPKQYPRNPGRMRQKPL